ncbi:MAG: inorganic phosphate transporter [Rhodospirillales bacterium]|nr:inorganic phosphate transporter [Rhodospirillales bacterium]
MAQPHDYKKLHKDLKQISHLEAAALERSQRPAKFGMALLFLIGVVAVAAFHSGGAENSLFIIAAGLLGGYMALNIGANDVANNVGPAVGSKALTMGGALVIAAVFEAAGAIVAGGDVVKTISKGIISPDLMPDSRTFILAMMAALMAAAAWVNMATVFGAPVSTTHAVVGGVMGAGIAATGFAAVNWPTMGAIAASWVISPFLGGLIAAGFLAFIKFCILFRDDKISAAQRWVPVLVAVMAATFSMYLVMKGLKHLWKPGLPSILMLGAAIFAASYFLVRPIITRKAATLENRRKSISSLFTIPLICSAALLSFAHGANDVANAIGPLAAIVETATTGMIQTKVRVPIWVMAIGAAGIAAGLVLYGPKLIRMVGEKITKLDRVRAFTVALSAAITVLIASALGLPVSSTHIAVGAVFGVGFLREFIAHRQRRRRAIEAIAIEIPEDAAVDDSGAESAPMSNEDKLAKKMEKARRRKLVRRVHLTTIISAWIITVPAAALLSVLLFFLLNAIA